MLSAVIRWRKRSEPMRMCYLAGRIELASGAVKRSEVHPCIICGKLISAELAANGFKVITREI